MGGAGPTSNIRLSLGRVTGHATPKADIHSIRDATPNSGTGGNIWLYVYR